MKRQKKTRMQEKLSNEEVVQLHEKIDVIEYQNTLNLERLENYAIREDKQRKKVKECKDNEMRLNQRCVELNKTLEQKNKEKISTQTEKNEVLEEFNQFWQKRNKEIRRTHTWCHKRNVMQIDFYVF